MFNLFKKPYPKPCKEGILNYFANCKKDTPKQFGLSDPGYIKLTDENNADVVLDDKIWVSFSNLYSMIYMLTAFEVKINNKNELVSKIISYQNEDGLFRNDPECESLLLSNLFAVETLLLLKSNVPNKEKLIKKIIQCEENSGRVSLLTEDNYQQDEKGFSLIEVLAYTTRLLYLLGGKYNNEKEVVSYLERFQRQDGLFMSKPYHNSGDKNGLWVENTVITTAFPFINLTQLARDKFIEAVWSHYRDNGQFVDFGGLSEMDQFQKEGYDSSDLYPVSLTRMYRALMILNSLKAEIKHFSEFRNQVLELRDLNVGWFAENHATIGKQREEIYYIQNIQKHLKLIEILKLKNELK